MPLAIFIPRFSLVLSQTRQDTDRQASADNLQTLVGVTTSNLRCRIKKNPTVSQLLSNWMAKEVEYFADCIALTDVGSIDTNPIGVSLSAKCCKFIIQQLVFRVSFSKYFIHDVDCCKLLWRQVFQRHYANPGLTSRRIVMICLRTPWLFCVIALALPSALCHHHWESCQVYPLLYDILPWPFRSIVVPSIREGWIYYSDWCRLHLVGNSSPGLCRLHLFLAIFIYHSRSFVPNCIWPSSASKVGRVITKAIARRPSFVSLHWHRHL